VHQVSGKIHKKILCRRLLVLKNVPNLTAKFASENSTKFIYVSFTQHTHVMHKSSSSHFISVMLWMHKCGICCRTVSWPVYCVKAA